ncbi:hypothetical protein [Motiliproteus sp. MSK22-1]|uniref:hypothetical protein n=1 Tax=Motiliproteus sp. MSK22-1 TaxID=1897630 RepID=UPI00097860D2|nr:hypothetical protein [Motiliproteus sp. MSK22-1]OMH30285.1 hypothetical protein BGP75_18005 [Motiliproteus sp. MSK22-1]
MDMTASAPATKKYGSLTLLLLIGLFGLPPLMGWLFFLNPQWLPDKHSNQGELIHPARPVYPLQLKWNDGRLLKADEFNDAWRMVVVARGLCDEICGQRLTGIDEVRRAIGGNQRRILPLIILLPAEGGGSSSRVAAKADEASTDTLWVTEESLEHFSQLFELDQHPLTDYTFVIDPMGALMMSHDQQRLSQKQILEDMEQLLKISQNWVKGTEYGHN